MASIVSVIVTSDTGTADRRIYFEITLQDNQGAQEIIKHGPVVADETFDASAAATEIAQRKLAGFISSEESDIEGVLESGEVLSRVTNVRWTEAKKVARMLILYMMRERDPRIVIALEPLIDYLRANYNATQLSNWLDITVAQVLKMNRRINAILSNTGSVKTLLTSFDAEEEEID